MKINQAVLFTLVAIAASPGFSQGKGGGNAGGGNPGQGKGGGADRAPMSDPATSKPADVSPPQRPGHPHAADPATSSWDSKGNGKAQRSASTAAHGLAGSMHDINQASFAQRRELHDTLDMRLKSSRDALKKIQSDAKDLRADARTEFKTALDEVKKRENELSDAVKASKKAREDSWINSRDQLARAYQNHAAAMARLEAIPRLPRP